MQWLRDYFDLNRGERRGIAILLVLILLLVIVNFSIPYVLKPDEKQMAEMYKLAEKLKHNISSKNHKDSFENEGITELEKEPSTKEFPLFEFDPNTATKEDFLRLGIKTKTVVTILKYREKGGHFYKKEDLRKIYGLDEATCERLEHYVNIPDSKHLNPPPRGGLYARTKDANPKVIVEINSADSEELLKISGIGPYFASRILKYRSMLGGFISKEQLHEVYGLDSDKYVQIEGQVTINPALTKKINLNTIEYDDLKRFPYLRYKLATGIIRYREQHGRYKSVDDLRKIKTLDEATITKIEPYICF